MFSMYYCEWPDLDGILMEDSDLLHWKLKANNSIDGKNYGKCGCADLDHTHVFGHARKSQVIINVYKVPKDCLV